MFWVKYGSQDETGNHGPSKFTKEMVVGHLRAVTTMPNPEVMKGHVSLLGMVSVFQENRVRIHVKFMFAWETCKLFPMQTKRKHNKIIPSVCI